MTETAANWRAFDSSVLILFLNDALAPVHVQTLNDALDAGRGQISLSCVPRCWLGLVTLR